ncbi:MAG: tetratricopeptide repeat-containing sensor histidine kinase [Bacteroidota bacterium]|nr:tetratricopeptide repeat-containing sensor histidine kinase [Bacteroidota bacterium]
MKQIRNVFYLLLFVMFFVTTANSQSGNKEIENLKGILEQDTLSQEERAISLINLSIEYYYKNKNEDALEYIIKGEKIAKSLKKQNILAKAYLIHGNIVSTQENTNKSLKYYFKSLKLYEQIKDYSNIVSVLYSIGETYRSIAMYDKSLHYLYQGLKIASQQELLDQKTEMHNRLSAVYYETKDYNKSLAYADSSLMYKKDDLSNWYLSNTYNIIGANYKDLKQYDSSIFYLKRSLKFGLKDKEHSNIAATYNNIASLYNAKKNHDSAIYFARKALNLSYKYNTLTYREVALLHISSAYKSMEVYDSALIYHIIYSGTKMEILDSERSQELAEMESKYGLRKNEMKNEKLLIQNKLKDNKIKGQNIIIFFIILIFTIVAYFYIIFRKRNHILKKNNAILKEHQNEIKNKSEQLENLNNTKDKILSIIAHDLKGPFHSIQGFSSLLMEETESNKDDELYLYSKHVNQGIEQLDFLLNNLLKWSQLQIGTIKITKTDILLKDLTTEITRLFEIALLTKKININIDISDKQLIFCDRASISTVFRNIISNALKFTPENGEIRISSKLTDKYTEIRITDSGVGMEKEVLDNLFTMKNKSRKGTNKEKGSGLGMLICKEFIENSGGKIEVESTVNKGTIIKLLLLNKEEE